MFKGKNSVEDLAICGGKPLFNEKLHVGRPNIGDQAKFLDRVKDILDRKWLSNNGPLVQEFEKKIADYIGAKHCIAMCNATIALEITTRALGFKGEVIVPSFTFVATPHSLQWQEITPVFCDIDPRNHCIDPGKIEALITPRTTGIIGVHLWGSACDVEAIRSIAKRHNLKFMFDAAHSFACSHNGKMVGSFGNAEIFSFHATKFFNTLEGGAVTTNDDDLAAKIRLMKNFGFSGYDSVIYIGTNGKMNETSAAMGLTNFESISTFINANKRNYTAYQEGLRGIPGIRLKTYNEQEKTNYQYIVLEIDENVTKISRDLLVNLLHAENIIARRYFYPGCHRMEPYKSYFPHAGMLLPETEKVCQKVMVLPTGASITPAEALMICSVLSFAIENASLVTKSV
ncbi:MAG: aminotransferase class I/II-fold pyridoxal phosphate-dependent enzyme [Chitinivibrionales bacterium]|nr:aminotransferase class I/II-fold pyridoxal phosphate-dependent enzyme [Chitinivibrionales bacterium]